LTVRVQDKLPYSFEHRGEQQIKNIVRTIRVYSLPVSSNRTSAAPAISLLPLPDRPSIAVLPFANMSGDLEQEFFADGMTEDIITALSRLRWLFVIARNSTLPIRTGPLTSGGSLGNLACDTFSKGVSEHPENASASQGN
jgi:adenylate cyclase